MADSGTVFPYILIIKEGVIEAVKETRFDDNDHESVASNVPSSSLTLTPFKRSEIRKQQSSTRSLKEEVSRDRAVDACSVQSEPNQEFCENCVIGDLDLMLEFRPSLTYQTRTE